MKKRGVIFDFNGTLFWDTEYQESSWDEYLRHHNIELTESQKRNTFMAGTENFRYQRRITKYNGKLHPYNFTGFLQCLFFQLFTITKTSSGHSTGTVVICTLVFTKQC